MTDYQNVKIANEIIIVEKPTPYRSWVYWRKVKGQGLHQGYVVDAGNKKSLETAMKWAVGTKVITGSNNKLNPKGTATRAETAAMIQKYCINIGI